jgi:hypothetical protein
MARSRPTPSYVPRSFRAGRSTRNDTADDHGDAPLHSAPARIRWARLLKRVFDIDIEHCPQCGGTLQIIAASEDPTVMAKILTHLGLPIRAPPRSPARAFDRL